MPMKLACVLLAVAVLTMPLADLCTAGPGSGSGAGAGEPKDMVGRFVGQKATTLQGKAAMVVNVMPATGGGVMKMILPDQDMMDLAKKLQSGDFVSITYMKSGHDLMVGKFETYEVKPGEDAPGVFVFLKTTTETVNKREVTTVTLSKFGTEATLTVPMAKNSEGKMAPKEELMKAIDGFKANDLVEVKAGGNTLLYIKLYEPPQLGEFLKVGKVKVGENDLFAVDVKVDGEIQTLAIPKKDTALLSKAKTFKSGELVYCRSSTDDKSTWLLEIRLAPKGTKLPSDKPKDDKPSKKGE
jgi:hypothetical protein